MTGSSYHKFMSSSADTGGSDVWSSPAWLVQALSDEFCGPGGFDLDAAANDENTKAPVWYDMDGLSRDWNVRTNTKGEICLCLCHLIDVNKTANGNDGAHAAGPGSPKILSTSPVEIRQVRGSSTGAPGAVAANGSTAPPECKSDEQILLKPSESAMREAGIGKAHRDGHGEGSGTPLITLPSGSVGITRKLPSPSLQPSGTRSVNSLTTNAPTANADQNDSRLITSSPSVPMTSLEPSSGTSSQPARGATSTKQAGDWRIGDQILCPECLMCSTKPSHVYCNPPYSKKAGGIPKWIDKAKAEVAAGHAELVVMLLPCRAGTHWFSECDQDPTILLRIIGRIRWRLDARGEAPFDSLVLVLGMSPAELKKHGTASHWCEVCGRRYWPLRSDSKTCSDACRRALSRAKRAAA